MLSPWYWWGYWFSLCVYTQSLSLIIWEDARASTTYWITITRLSLASRYSWPRSWAGVSFVKVRSDTGDKHWLVNTQVPFRELGLNLHSSHISAMIESHFLAVGPCHSKLLFLFRLTFWQLKKSIWFKVLSQVAWFLRRPRLRQMLPWEMTEAIKNGYL